MSLLHQSCKLLFFILIASHCNRVFAWGPFFDDWEDDDDYTVSTGKTGVESEISLMNDQPEGDEQQQQQQDEEETTTISSFGEFSNSSTSSLYLDSTDKITENTSPSSLYSDDVTVKKTESSDSNSNGVDYGEKLFLTPLLSNLSRSSPEVWRQLALVKNLSAVTSYSGFLTTNEQLGSNLFFWFFPAAYNPENAPLLLWLNGGPGTSSLFGLFVENGPFFVDDEGFLQYRKNPWTLTHSILYIDSPVGTGFSFTQSEEGYARNQDDVSRDLYEALIQFFTVFPEYASRDFYVCGESYAGKYAPSIAYKIYKENSRRGPQLRINLKGLIIGSGFSDPLTQNEYGDYLYNMGLIDEVDMQYFKTEEEKIRKLIKIQNWRMATEAVQSLILGFPHSQRSHFENLTQFRFYMNILKTTVPQPYKNYAEFLSRDSVRRSLHVGDQRFTRTSKTVLQYMLPDICKSVKPSVEKLLNEDYRMLIYAPQLDIIVPHTGIQKYLKSLRWIGARQYSETPRKVWRVNNEIAGYTKTARGLVHLVMRNAGHLASYDQPMWAFEMVNRFTRGLPF